PGNLGSSGCPKRAEVELRTTGQRRRGATHEAPHWRGSMEELLVEFLETTVEEDLVPEIELIISDDLLTGVVIEEELLSTAYSQVCKSLSVFKGWIAATLKLTEEAVNAIIALQFIFNMITTHYSQAVDSNRCISVSGALQDIEATLVKNYRKMRELATKLVAAPSFAKLPAGVQAQIRSIETRTPREYWLSMKIEIMKSLLKIHIYDKS